MADINQLITLGIGTPAGIKEFLTFGLQLGAAPPSPWAPQSDVSTTWSAQTDDSSAWTKQTDQSTSWTDQ